MRINNLVIVDDYEKDPELTDYFKDKPLIRHIKTTNNEKELLDTLEVTSCDILCVVMMNDHYDGFEIIEKVKSSENVNEPRHICCIIDFVSNFIVSRLNNLGIDYTFVRPNSYDVLYDNMCYLANDDVHFGFGPGYDPHLDYEIVELLHEIGVPAHIKGYIYLREAIMMVYKNPDIMGCVTKELYPSIALTFNSTVTRVERAIRNAIEISWKKNNAEVIGEVFSNTLGIEKLKPTNSEFIAMIADRIRLKNLKENRIRYIA